MERETVRDEVRRIAEEARAASGARADERRQAQRRAGLHGGGVALA